jgi:hypothetical protein
MVVANLKRARDRKRALTDCPRCFPSSEVLLTVLFNFLNPGSFGPIRSHVSHALP